MKIFSGDVKISIKIKDKESIEVSEPRFEQTKNKLKIYSKTVKFSQVYKSLIRDFGSLQKDLVSNCINNISWIAVAEKMETRSSDDIRQYWSRYLLPLFIPDQTKWND